MSEDKNLKRSQSPSNTDDNIPKKLKLDSKEKKTYLKGGSVHFLHGNVYQLKLQMLFLNRALKNDYKFELGTEVVDAGKFDDIVFKCKHKFRVLQAKLLEERIFYVLLHKGQNIGETKRNNKNTVGVTKYVKFRTDFVNGHKLSENVKLFRDSLKSALDNENDGSALNSLNTTSLNFDEIFDLLSTPNIINPKELAQKIAKIISDAQGKTASPPSEGGKKDRIVEDIEKLVGHVLLQLGEQNAIDGARISFCKLFSNDDDSIKLSDNLKELKNEIIKITKGKVDCNELKDLEFIISNCYTCYETSKGKLLLPKNAFPIDKVEDSEVKDILKELVAVTQPGENKQKSFLKRALNKANEIHLDMEVEDVKKGDIVFEYTSFKKSFFVQAKHKRNNDGSKKITAKNLLAVTNAEENDFSLQKYFMTYRAINKELKFSKEKCRDFILYTNIDFDIKNLEKSNINITKRTQSDDILDITSLEKSGVCYKLNIQRNHPLYEILKETSDLHLLAKQLAAHIPNNKKYEKLELRSDVLKLYHGVLSEKVFKNGIEKETQYVEFRTDFLEGNELSEDTKIFRKALKSALNIGDEDSSFMSLLNNKKFNISLDSGKKITYQKKPVINNPKELAEKFVQIIEKAEGKLEEHISNNETSKKLELWTDVLKLCHGVLSKKVFTIVNEKTKYVEFLTDFVKGNDKLSEDAEIFRNALKSALNMEDKDCLFMSLLDNKKFNVSLNFGKKFESQSINKPEELAAKIVENIKEAKGKPVKITRETGRKGGVIKDNIEKLAGYIFVQVGEKNAKGGGPLKFSKLFLKDDDDNKLPGNLKEFKDKFFEIAKDKIDCDELKDLEFTISNFYTCYETSEGELLLPKDTLPTDIIKDCEIEDFLTELVFAVNQPDEVALGEIITEELGKSSQFNLLDADLVAASFQKEMLDWFKKKNGEWLDKKSGGTFFNKIEKQVKHMVSIGLSLAHPDRLREYGIELKNNNITQKFKTFISSMDVSKNILHIRAQETTVFSAVKMCKTLESLKNNKDFSRYTRYDSLVFIRLEELLLPKTQKLVMDALESTHNYHFLIIDCCESTATNNDQIEHLYENLRLTKKKIILITKKDDMLASKFSNDKKNDCPDETSFGDLTRTSKRTLLEKKILFIGEDIRLKHLYFKLKDSQAEPTDEELNGIDFDIIDIEPLAPLLSNTKVKVGCKPQGTSDLEGGYYDLPEEVNVKTFVGKLTEKSIDDIYIISGIHHLNKDDLIEHLRKNNTTESEVSDIKNQMQVFGRTDIDKLYKRIQVADDLSDKGDFELNGFKKVCKENSTKKVYWIHVQNEKFKAKKMYDPYFYVECKRFTNEVIFEKSIKNLFVSNDLPGKFIINVEDKNNFETWLDIQNDERVQFKKNCRDNKIIILTPENNLEGTHETAHLLEFKKKELVWNEPAVQSETDDSLNLLVKYRAKSCESTFKPLIEEGSLIRGIRNKNIVIIAGDPGVGKSTTLVHLYESENKSQSEPQESILKSHWVMKINLKDRVVLKTIRNINFHKASDIEIITRFLSQVDASLEVGKAKNFLTAALSKPNFGRPLLLAFDGFDEVLDVRDRKNIISLLKKLKCKKIRFWVSTRLHYEEDLEGALSTFATRLGSMDEPAIRNFIAKSFGNRLYLLLDQEEFENIFGDSYKYKVIEKYTESFIHKMNELFNADGHEFIGTPLQLFLMLENSKAVIHFREWAECFLDSIRNTSSPEPEPNFGYLGKDIWEVFEKFIDSKYDTYFKKEDFRIKLQEDQNKKTFDDYYMNLAISFILEPETKKDLGDFKDIILLSGIVRSDGRNIDFIHPTLKDYFAAKVFLRWICEESSELSNPRKKEYFLKEILMKTDHRFIRVLINIKLKDIVEQLRENSLKPFKDSMSTLWELKPNPLINSDGETILHIAFAENKKGIVKFLLKIIDDKVMEKLMEVRDNNHRTVLYVAMKNTPEIIKDLLERVERNGKSTQEKIILATTFRSQFDRNDYNITQISGEFKKYNSLNKTYIGLGLQCDKYKIIKKFLNARGIRQIEEILEKQRNENVKYFLLKSVTKKGNNILHKAGRLGDPELVKFLLEKYKEHFDVNARCNKRRTVLHKAARAGSSRTVEYLMGNGAKTDIKDDWDNTPLRDALRSGNFDTIQCFSNEDLSEELFYNDFKGRTPLHDAVVLDRLDVVKWILEKLGNESRVLTVLESAKELADTISKKESDEEQDEINKGILADDKTNRKNIKEIIDCLDQKISEIKKEIEGNEIFI